MRRSRWKALYRRRKVPEPQSPAHWQISLGRVRASNRPRNRSHPLTREPWLPAKERSRTPRRVPLPAATTPGWPSTEHRTTQNPRAANGKRPDSRLLRASMRSSHCSPKAQSRNQREMPRRASTMSGPFRWFRQSRIQEARRPPPSAAVRPACVRLERQNPNARADKNDKPRIAERRW